jgi:hypothetical protein
MYNSSGMIEFNIVNENIRIKKIPKSPQNNST